jgi:hypothetical protein
MFGLTSAGDPDPNNVTVNSADSIAAFTKIKELGEKGAGALKTSIAAENVVATFTGKKAAFFITGSWNIADIKKAGIKYDITPVPAFAGGKPAQPFLGVQAFFVAAKGKSKAMAQEFVANYVTNKEVERALRRRPPPAGAAGRAGRRQGRRPGRGEVAGRGQGRPADAGHPGDGRDLGPVRQRRGQRDQGRRPEDGGRRRGEGDHRRDRQEEVGRQSR